MNSFVDTSQQTASAGPVAHGSSRRHLIGLVIVAAAVLVLSAFMFLAPSNKLLVGAAVVMLMIALMLLEIPVFITMMVAATLGLLAMAGPRALWGLLQDVVFTSFGSWSLSVIPMFVLMGVAMSKTGIMAGAYDAARKWLAPVPGGLAVSTTVAGAGLASVSGSTIAITYAIGRVSIPEMLRSGYKPALALGSVATAGTLGQVIPPSVLLVIYAGVASTPVGPQLLAGIVPGLILAVLFTGVIIGWALLVKDAAPKGARYSWGERLASLRGLIPVLLLMILVLGGIFSGFFTVTESGALGAVAALLIGGVIVALRIRNSREASVRVKTAPTLGRYIGSTLMETVASVAAVFALLIGVNMLTRVMALSGLTRWIADMVVDLGFTKIGFLMLLIPIYLILGFFLDTLAMMLLTIPVFLGPLAALEVDLIWFGIFLIVLAEIDLIAPPLGILNFVVLGIARSVHEPGAAQVTIMHIFKGVAPFIGACILFLVLLVIFPEIATWLPGLSSAK